MIKKLFFIQLILCFAFLDCCCGQTPKLINIPVIKESTAVDVVLDKFIAQRRASLKNLSTLGGVYQDGADVLLRDSCLLIPMTPEDSLKNVNIYVQSNAKTSINQEINIDVALKFRYACFGYKGYKVFIWTRTNFGPLFSETGRTQTYEFVYYADKTQNYPKIMVNDGRAYQIKGKTIAEHVSTVITSKGNK